MKGQELDELISLLQEKVTTSAEELKKYSSGLFYISSPPPDAVCYPEDDNDVLTIINFCVKHRIPVIPYGSGTSVEGHTVALHGGIYIDMRKMNKVLEFNPIDDYVIVQAGMPYNKLNDFLEPQGYHFPVEAGWGASIGGMTATNASGAGAISSGSMAKNVISCSVIVYKSGIATKVKTGTFAPKSSAGYNLTNLFVGSEGTLGVITDVAVKISKNFHTHNTICCQFADIQDAVQLVVSLKGRIPFKRVELLDTLQTNACIAYSNISSLENNLNTLIIELAGNQKNVEDEISLLKKSMPLTCRNVSFFQDQQLAEPIWMMRKNAGPAAMKYIDPNKKAIVTDVSVPLSKLSDCIRVCYQHMVNCRIKAPLVAHLGDGNFHFVILVDPNSPKELETANTFNKLVVSEALKYGGTCTGEHGIGIGKMASLREEHADGVYFMEAIKKAFDPLAIFNPGKVLAL